MEYGLTTGTYEIYITTDEKSLSLNNFISGYSFDSVVIKNSGDKINITDLSYAFKDCNYLKSIDLSKFDISGVTNFYRTFYDCKNLVSINIGSLLPQKLQNMGYMFYQCYSLISINLLNFDTSYVIDMSHMFNGCSGLISINLLNFDTSKVIDMSYMFNGCSSLISINISSFDTSNVMDMSYMFYDCYSLISINLSSFDTSNVIDMSYMFNGCFNLISINLSNFDTSNATNLSSMFKESYSITSLNLSNFDTSKANDMKSIFYNCISLIHLNIENFDISNVAYMNKMFYNCQKLSYIKIKNFAGKYIYSTSEMFYGCNSLTSIDFNKFIVEKVTKLDYMFYNCIKLKSLDLSNFDTSSTITMESMFSGCESLNYLNINNFNTSLVTNMNNMFKNCKSLTSLNLLSFNINEETNIDFMFLQSSESFIYCIEDISFPKIESQLADKKCAIRDYNCLNGWSEIPKKIIDENDECVENCNSTDNFKYEYNGKCYSSCPKGTTTFFNKNNNLICQSLEIEEILQKIENEKEIDNYSNLLYKYCDPNDFFKKECVPPKQVQNSDNMITLIKNSISEGKMDSIIEEVLNNKNNLIESYDSIFYQITTTFNQKNNEYKNISRMELEECEDVLKNVYNISKNYSLIIFKYDYFIPELLIPIIGYELYHPNTKQNLDLNYCKKNKTKINILIPVQINEREVYKHNPNHAYYKDRCNTDSNNKNIDITIYDKKNIYNEKNLALCAKNCEFDGYNNSTQKVKCICEPQFNNSLLTLDDIINKKKLINDFIDIHSLFILILLNVTKNFYH